MICFTTMLINCPKVRHPFLVRLIERVYRRIQNNELTWIRTDNPRNIRQSEEVMLGFIDKEFSNTIQGLHEDGDFSAYYLRDCPVQCRDIPTNTNKRNYQDKVYSYRQMRSVRYGLIILGTSERLCK